MRLFATRKISEYHNFKGEKAVYIPSPCFQKHKSGEYFSFSRFVLRENTQKGGRGANVPLFETIKTNVGTQPKNELQQ